MKNKFIHITLTLAVALAFATVRSLAHEGGEEDKSPIPVTLGATWQAVLKKHAELQGATASQSLPMIHMLAFRLRDLCNTLPQKSGDLPAEKLRRVQGAVKNIARLAEELDKTGDARDLPGTQANLKKLDGLLKLLANQYEPAALADISKEPPPSEAALKAKEHAHSDHESKRGGVLMMMNDWHIEGVQVDNQFRVYLFNEFTRPVPVGKIPGKLVLPKPSGAKPDDDEPTTPLQLSQDGMYLHAERPANYPDDFLTVRLVLDGQEGPFSFPIYQTTEATCTGCTTKTIAGLQAVSACGMCSGKLNPKDKKVVCSKCSAGVALKSPELLTVAFQPNSVVETAIGDGSPMQQLLGAYYRVQTALASDDLKSAQEKAKQLAELAAKLAEGERAGFAKISETAASLAKAKDLAQARKIFGEISKATIEELNKTPKLGQKYYIIHCPMTKDGNGNWVQPSAHVTNPYFGSKMLNCGAVKKEGK